MIKRENLDFCLQQVFGEPPLSEEEFKSLAAILGGVSDRFFLKDVASSLKPYLVGASLPGLMIAPYGEARLAGQCHQALASLGIGATLIAPSMPASAIGALIADARVGRVKVALLPKIALAVDLLARLFTAAGGEISMVIVHDLLFAEIDAAGIESCAAALTTAIAAIATQTPLKLVRAVTGIRTSGATPFVITGAAAAGAQSSVTQAELGDLLKTPIARGPAPTLPAAMPHAPGAHVVNAAPASNAAQPLGTSASSPSDDSTPAAIPGLVREVDAEAQITTAIRTPSGTPSLESLSLEPLMEADGISEIDLANALDDVLNAGPDSQPLQLDDATPAADINLEDLLSAVEPIGAPPAPAPIPAPPAPHPPPSTVAKAASAAPASALSGASAVASMGAPTPTASALAPALAPVPAPVPAAAPAQTSTADEPILDIDIPIDAFDLGASPDAAMTGASMHDAVAPEDSMLGLDLLGAWKPEAGVPAADTAGGGGGLVATNGKRSACCACVCRSARPDAQDGFDPLGGGCGSGPTYLRRPRLGPGGP